MIINQLSITGEFLVDVKYRKKKKKNTAELLFLN